MNTDKAIEAIRQCGGRSGILDKRGQGWSRLYIQNSEGVQVGRLSFQHGELMNIKSYKRDYHRTVDETDLIFLRFTQYARTGRLISLSRFWALWEQAQSIAQKDLADKQARRDKLPVRKPGMRRRPRLQGKNPRMIFIQLLGEE